MLVLWRVHGVSELIGGCPKMGLKPRVAPLLFELLLRLTLAMSLHFNYRISISTIFGLGFNLTKRLNLLYTHTLNTV